MSYNGTTRTLTWTAATVNASGTLTYKATVDIGAAELEQPLTNIATIDSDQTPPDDDTSDVFVPVPPLVETDVPTAPPTDTLEPAETSTGSSLPLILAVLGIILLAVAFVTPVPATVQAPEPPLGTFAQPIVRSLRGSAVGWFVSAFPHSCVATPSGVRSRRSTILGGVPRSFWRVCRSAGDRGLEAGVDQLDGSVEASPDARRSWRRGRIPSGGG